VLHEFDAGERSQVAAVVRYGKNIPIQGSSADITKRSMTVLDESLDGLDARMVNTIHDELVVECEASIAEDVRERVETAMVSAGREYIKSIPVVVETAVGPAWTK
jgi:DNA polymerase-1